MSTPAASLDRLNARAAALDADDPLAPSRESFVLAEGLIYLDGNSLGPLADAVARRLQQTVRVEWGGGLIASWNDAGWYELPLTVGDRLGALIGAEPGQVAVCDTTTTNLFKAMSAAFDLQQRGAGDDAPRDLLLVDGADFPANLYVSEGAVRVAGRQIERRALGGLAGESGAVSADPLEAIRQLSEREPGRLGVVALSQVNYRSGRLHDLAAVTAAAHEAGALVIWDLCHSAGVMPIDLDAAGVDFAVGCTYKYLNSGPGAPAFIYVAQRHLGAARQPLSGWMGHANPFAFEQRYEADPGIRGFLCGTPHIVSLRAVDAALQLFEDVDVAALRKKSVQLTELFRETVGEACGVRGVDMPRLVSPGNPEQRGAQITWAHPHGYEVVQALISRGVVGDFRAPDGMRFGFSPLIVRHVEAVRAAEELVRCIEEEVWSDERFAQRGAVT